MPIIGRLERTSRRRAAWVAGVLLVGVGGMVGANTGQLRQALAQEDGGKLTSANPVNPSGFAAASPSATAGGVLVAGPLMREGTKIVNQSATCRSSGDRLQVILAEDSTPVIALENLASQRILKAAMDDAGDERWVINGQITEFQGRNFILLDRVTRQPKQLR